MKKLFTILLVMVLTSCMTALEPPKSNTDYKNIIGKPIKIGNIEVAQYDFPDQMNWNDAKLACAKLGKGWRLPTKNELNILYINRDKIGRFARGYYWSSSTEDSNNKAWIQFFPDGLKAFYPDEDYDSHVRAIKPF